MKNIITYLLITLFVVITGAQANAQTKKVLGKVIAKTRDLEGIYVKNTNTNEAVLTQKGGYFTIKVKPNDTLIFSAVHLIGREKVFSYGDLNKSMVFIPMAFTDNVLEELVIDKRVTTESLGLGGARRLTPAERRLHTATSSGGGILPIDMIVNAISGRTKMLEKALELEKENMFVKRILSRFSDDFYVNKLNIPEKYLMAFGYFMAQDPLITTSYQTVDLTQLSLLYTEKATEFLEIVNVLK